MPWKSEMAGQQGRFLSTFKFNLEMCQILIAYPISNVDFNKVLKVCLRLFLSHKAVCSWHK